ncbi:cobalamin-independent methionine synthase II family protein [Cellulomonas marina]|uniref:5-methyltetrahydropteroyltriglutamate--homocysteine methyltransferase n=1 Tax=Cellulomonas marina TaxID=988821 RepID=A0A1I0XWD2_9CELL|nr:cobalamin-independent methionine synthase II family protein [Cellulomonas marina]GIG28496.1 methionine synthase [Cellulomonas marina]SFB05312.1 5-methyltetrahydropteroyltriglutamate--homocysteine methyltransferase [Cellulomonas marina]
MLRSDDAILTTHAGSLPRTHELVAANRARQEAAQESAQGAGNGVPEDWDAFLGEQVRALVERQLALGISVPGDGEYGKAMSSPMDFGAWWSYSFQRTGGLALDERAAWATEKVVSGPGEVRLTGFSHRRDQQRFAEAYTDPTSGIFHGAPPVFPEAVGDLTYTGQDAIAADVRHLRAALDATGAPEGFVTSLAPGSAARIHDATGRSDEEFLYAWADVLREEYTAIIDAGLVLQIDDPSVAESWDQIEPEPSLEDYLAFTRLRVEALNHALRGLPKDRIRFHLCWGSWHGPHTTDLPMADIVSTMLGVHAGAFSFEAANVRHEHEYRVWDDVVLPDDAVILPGVVSHATNVVEHPELVAERIERFAQRVGRERVVASTDCGLGGRVHAQIAWAKLESLVAGAELASRRLWR